MTEPENGSAPVDFVKTTDAGPYAIRVRPPGAPTVWWMMPKYARELAAALEGAAVAVERLNGERMDR